MQEKKRYRRYLPWAIALLLLITLFFFSAQRGVASHGISIGLTGRVMAVLEPYFDFVRTASETVLSGRVNYILRKAAHVTIFFFLTIFVLLGYRGVLKKKRLVVAATFLTVLAAAGLDELHQVFVAGRSASLSDVLVDSIGIAAALAAVGLFLLIRRAVDWL